MTNNDIRWQQRFANYQKALERLNQAAVAVKNDPGNQLYQMALIQAFEFTFELGWKVVKDYLKYNGIEARLPRDAIKEGFASGIIEDGQRWIDMMDDRNATSHSYDEEIATRIINNLLDNYVSGFKQLSDYLTEKL